MNRNFDVVAALDQVLDPQTFSAIIRSHRILLNLTQEELGKKFGVTKQTVNDYEAGRHIPSIEKALQIGAKLGLPSDDVVRGVFADILAKEGRQDLIKQVLTCRAAS